MRKILVLILLLIINFFPMLGQSLENEKTLVFTKGTSIKKFDRSTSVILDNDQLIAQSGWKFKIDEKIENGYVIRFLRWETRSDQSEIHQKRNLQFVFEYESSKIKNEKGEEIQNSFEKPLYFFIEDKTFENSVKEFEGENPLWSFVTGAVTVPIKIRPGSEEINPQTGSKLRPFDFANEINVGLSAGVRLRVDNKKRAFINFIGGISITSIPIDEVTTMGFVTAKTNAAAITPSYGLIFQYDDFQIGVINGWDFLSREVGENWVYQGSPWFGLGLGLSIFSTNNSADQND